MKPCSAADGWYPWPHLPRDGSPSLASFTPTQLTTAVTHQCYRAIKASAGQAATDPVPGGLGAVPCAAVAKCAGKLCLKRPSLLRARTEPLRSCCCDDVMMPTVQETLSGPVAAALYGAIVARVP